jgi:N-acetylmuramoyl-L-alanine amidase
VKSAGLFALLLAVALAAAAPTVARAAPTAPAALSAATDDDEPGSGDGENGIDEEEDEIERGLSEALEIEPGVRVLVQGGRDLALSVEPDEGDDYGSLAARFGGAAGLASALREANGDRPVVFDRAVEIPWNLLRNEYRYLALRTLFPRDAFRNGAWEHDPAQARALVYHVGLWQVGEWFTGKGENWQEIARLNGFPGPDVPPGRTVRIPAAMLLAPFRPAIGSTGGVLVYGEDAEGPYAEYALQKGEALYSAVIIRFTGLLHPTAVLEAADLVAKRSGIADVTKMPTGQKLKIPLEMLATPYLPENDPRRVTAALEERELEAAPLPALPRSLKGVHVLLDPGHGGADIGARSGRHGVWESDYVYDVTCRVGRLLAKEPGVTVHFLVRDGKSGCRVQEVRKLPMNKKRVVATRPPHLNQPGASTKAGVNLRWYLANSIYRELVSGGVAPESIVFLSLHADSLHKDLSGAMVYVPGERYRRGSYGVRGESYARYAEWREAPSVSFSRAERLRDEKLSTKLAKSILDGYRAEKLPVHDDEPIRDHIVRGVRGRRGVFVPAVLRGAAVPAKVLLETANINNPKDAALLADPAGRERMARAVVRGVRGYFGGKPKRGQQP